MDLATYHAAHDACVRSESPDRAWLELAGADARDFLQRIASSDLRPLAPGSGQWSALLDGKGHWIADLLLYCLPGASEEEFGLDLPAERADAVAERLSMMHFAERFVMRRPTASRLLLLGPHAEQRALELGMPVPEDRKGFGVARTGKLTILRRPDRGKLALEILGSAEELQLLDAQLARAGVPRAGAEVRETLRIESFVPRWGADFDAESTLPNSNEWRRASVSKGCYAGQEIVARINTYGQASRQLCRLRAAEGGAESLAGAELQDSEGRALGTVTSWCWSPRANRGLGLGLLRRKAAVEGIRLQACAAALETTVVVELPPMELG